MAKQNRVFGDSCWRSRHDWRYGQTPQISKNSRKGQWLDPSPAPRGRKRENAPLHFPEHEEPRCICQTLYRGNLGHIFQYVLPYVFGRTEILAQIRGIPRRRGRPHLLQGA